jgi:hypothetical protein
MRGVMLVTLPLGVGADRELSAPCLDNKVREGYGDDDDKAQ